MKWSSHLSWIPPWQHNISPWTNGPIPSPATASYDPRKSNTQSQAYHYTSLCHSSPTLIAHQIPENQLFQILLVSWYIYLLKQTTITTKTWKSFVGLVGYDDGLIYRLHMTAPRADIRRSPVRLWHGACLLFSFFSGFFPLAINVHSTVLCIYVPQ